MHEAGELNYPERKVKALRRIRLLLDQTERIRARDAGLKEGEFLELVDEGLIEVTHGGNGDTTLETHYIEKILPSGELMLAESALAAPSPLKISVETPPKSAWQRIFEGTRSGLWDLIKIAFGAVLGAILTKYFGK